MKKGIYAVLAICTIFALVLGVASCGGDDKPATYTVTFNSNGGSDVAPITGVESGAKIAKPDDPTKAGYNFGAWYKEDTLATVWSFDSDVVTGDTTLYAAWDTPDTTVPQLATLVGGNYKINTTADVSMRITVTNATAIGATNLSYQWYSSDAENGAGTKVGTDSRDYTPAVDAEGTTWYWVVVTNKTTGETATSNHAKVIVYIPAKGTIEKITVANAAVPLWEFTKPADASWADYTKFTIKYYVSKTSNIFGFNQQIRSRLYGAYLEGDFVTPDQGDDKDWGGYRIVSWNTNPMTNAGRENQNINPNNDFIIDNSKGNPATFSAGGMFGSVSGAAKSVWFETTYDTNAGIAKNINKVTNIDDTVDTIYVGAGIFGPGGDETTLFEFYTDTPTLVNSGDPTKNIVGKPFMTGTTEQLFAGNRGGNRNGTERSVLDEEDATAGTYKDVDGVAVVQFNLNGGKAPDGVKYLNVSVDIGATMGAKFPAINPTRTFYTFVDWRDNDGNAYTASTAITTDVVLLAKWDRAFMPADLSIDLTGQTLKNSFAWTTNYNDGFILDLGEDFTPDTDKYDTLVFELKFYDASNNLIVDGDNKPKVIGPSFFQLKFFGVGSPAGTPPANANASNIGTVYNMGQGLNAAGDAAEGNAVLNDDETAITWTATIPAGARSSGVRYLGIQSGNADPKTAQYIEVISITASNN